jgi:hypothetical protein
MNTATALGLFFGGLLVAIGVLGLIYGVRGLLDYNYKPRHTRSTYLPPKR